MRQEVEQRVKDREIPFEKRGDQVVFRKNEIDQWASQRILGFPSQRLEAYHQKSTRHTRKILAHETILREMLEAGAVAPAMSSRTKASVLRDLVALAEKTGHVCDAKALLASLETREELCSTAVSGGFALPHRTKRIAHCWIVIEFCESNSHLTTVGNPTIVWSCRH